MNAAYLSFADGRPIGIVKGGKHKNKLIGIVEQAPTGDKKIPTPILDKSFFDGLSRKKYGRVTALTKEKLKRYVEKGVEPEGSLGEMWREAQAHLKGREGRVLEIVDGELEPVPHGSKRECLYVAGPSGSGKSTYVSRYAKNFKKLFPDKDIYLFSKVGDDECLDKLGVIRLEINEELVEDPIQADELRDCLVIFDDTDTISDNNVRKAMTALKNDILETGRHYNTYCVITSHLISNYSETRKVLNECHSITFFPSSGSAHPIRYCLKKHMGMGKADIDRVFTHPSRWVTAFKHYPQCIMHAKGAYLLRS